MKQLAKGAYDVMGKLKKSIGHAERKTRKKEEFYNKTNET